MMKLTMNFLLIGSAFAGSFPPPGKEYIEPAPDAQRSNCPAINVSTTCKLARVSDLERIYRLTLSGLAFCTNRRWPTTALSTATVQTWQ